MSTSPSNAATPRKPVVMKRTSSSAVNGADRVVPNNADHHANSEPDTAVGPLNGPSLIPLEPPSPSHVMMLGDHKRKSKLSSSFRLRRPATAAAMEVESGDSSSSSSIPSRFLELLKRPFVKRKQFQQQPQPAEPKSSSRVAKNGSRKSTKREAAASQGRHRPDLAAEIINQSSSEDEEEPEVVQVDGQLLRTHSLPQIKPHQVPSRSQERAVRVNFIPADKGLHNSRYSGKNESPQQDSPNSVKGSSSSLFPSRKAGDSSPQKGVRRLPALKLDSIISSGLDSSKGDMEEASCAMNRARQQWILQYVMTADDARSATQIPEEPCFEPQLESTAPGNEVARKRSSRGSLSSTADGGTLSSTGGKKRLSVERRKSIEKRMSIERKRQSVEFFRKDIGEDQLVEETQKEAPNSSAPFRKRHSCSVPHLKRHTSEPKLNASGATEERNSSSIRSGRRATSSRNLVRGKFKTNDFFGVNPKNVDDSSIAPEQIDVLQHAIRHLEKQSLSPSIEPDTPDIVLTKPPPAPQLKQHATSITSPLTSPRPEASPTVVTNENMSPSIGMLSHQQNILTASMQALSSILHRSNEGASDHPIRPNSVQLLGLQPRLSISSSSGSDTQNTAKRRQQPQQVSPCEASFPAAAEIVLHPTPHSPPQTANFVLKPFQHLMVCPAPTATTAESGNESDTLCVFQTPPTHCYKPLHTVAQSETFEAQPTSSGELDIAE